MLVSQPGGSSGACLAQGGLSGRRGDSRSHAAAEGPGVPGRSTRRPPAPPQTQKAVLMTSASREPTEESTALGTGSDSSSGAGSRPHELISSPKLTGPGCPQVSSHRRVNEALNGAWLSCRRLPSPAHSATVLWVGLGGAQTHSGGPAQPGRFRPWPSLAALSPAWGWAAWNVADPPAPPGWSVAPRGP